MATKIKHLLERKGYIVTKQRQNVINMVCGQTLITDLDGEWIKLRSNSSVSWATMRLTIKIMQELNLLTSEKPENLKKQFKLNKEAIYEQLIRYNI